MRGSEGEWRLVGEDQGVERIGKVNVASGRVLNSGSTTYGRQ